MTVWRMEASIVLDVYVEDEDDSMSLEEIRQRGKAVVIDDLYDLLDEDDAMDMVTIKSACIADDEK